MTEYKCDMCGKQFPLEKIVTIQETGINPDDNEFFFGQILLCHKCHTKVLLYIDEKSKENDNIG